MIIKDTRKERGCCPICDVVAEFLDGDCIEEEMWETYKCNKCGIIFSEMYEIKHVGFEIHVPKKIEY